MYKEDEEGRKIWKPTLKQEKFLSIPTSIKEAFFGGGAGSGKSELLLMYSIANGWYKNPRFKQVFMRRTFPELRNEIVPRSKELFRPLGANFNKQDMTWTFPSGAMIFLASCEYDDDVHNFDSMEINLYTPDELTSESEWIYTYVGFQRVRTSDPELPAIIRAAGMPGNIGHTWVYNRFVKPCPEGNKVLIGRGGIKRIFIPATVVDNPHIDKSYTQSLDALDEAERRAKKFGDWNAYEGSVFDEFREKHYTGEPDNALHVIPPFDIPKHWPRICSIDWGYSAMTSIGFGAISPKGRLYVYRHLSFIRTKIEIWAPQLNKFILEDQPEDIVICHSANQNRGEPHTILEQVEMALGRQIRLGEKNRIAGKILLHEYLRWESKVPPASEVDTYDSELATWIKHNKGESEYLRYLSLFQAKKNEEIPKLLFFDTPDVKMIWEAIKSCMYEKSNKSGKNKEDVAEFAGDDPYDMLRMLLHSADKYFEQSSEAQRKIEERDEVIEKFNQTQDMTSYYRNMRRLESENIIKPVRLSRINRSYRVH
jgi:hypothetical protein